MNTRSITELILWWVDEYNKGSGWVEALAGPEFEWIERPSAKFPNGRQGDGAVLRELAIRNVASTPSRRLEVRRVMELSDTEGVIEYVHDAQTESGIEQAYVGVTFLTFRRDRLEREVDYVIRFERNTESGALIPY